MAGSVSIEVTETREWKRVCPDAGRFARQAACAALRAAGMRLQGRPIELGITLVDDPELRRLNRTWRGRDAPTNVLAFPASEPGAVSEPGMPVLLGDVVLACETVAREAAEQKKSPADHLRHLVVHGVLHLLGHDHDAEVPAREMESLERAILAGLGVPDPYRDTI